MSPYDKSQHNSLYSCHLDSPPPLTDSLTCSHSHSRSFCLCLPSLSSCHSCSPSSQSSLGSGALASKALREVASERRPCLHWHKGFYRVAKGLYRVSIYIYIHTYIHILNHRKGVRAIHMCVSVGLHGVCIHVSIFMLVCLYM